GAQVDVHAVLVGGDGECPHGAGPVARGGHDVEVRQPGDPVDEHVEHTLAGLRRVLVLVGEVEPDGDVPACGDGEVPVLLPRALGGEDVGRGRRRHGGVAGDARAPV